MVYNKHSNLVNAKMGLGKHLFGAVILFKLNGLDVTVKFDVNIVELARDDAAEH